MNLTLVITSGLIAGCVKMNIKKLTKEIIEQKKIPKTFTLEYKVIEKLIKLSEENKISTSTLANEILKKAIVKDLN